MKTPTNLPIDNPAWPLLQAMVSYWGITDNDGNVAGTTIRCRGLATEPPYHNSALKMLSGPCAGQVKDVILHPAGTDTLTVAEAFTNNLGVAQQIVRGTIFVILSQLPAIAEVHGVFTVLPSAPDTVEPDTTQDLSLSISTVEGIPVAANLTAGTITITRVRAGVETVIVNAAACAVANGRIFYNYAFPAASWHAGDEYKAVFSGQQVTVGAATYTLSDMRCKGRVSRESVAAGGETAGTHIHADNVNWQNVFEWTPLTIRRKVHGIWLDFVNLVQNMNMRLQYKIDGITYRTFWTDTWATTDEEGVLITWPPAVSDDLRLDIQSVIAEGAPKNIPYKVIYEDME